MLGGMNNRLITVLPRNEDALTALRDYNVEQDDDSMILEINQIAMCYFVDWRAWTTMVYRIL